MRTIHQDCSVPSPRTNFTLTAIHGGDFLLFGGEYYDGAEAKCYNDLYRYVVTPGDGSNGGIQFTTPFQFAILSTSGGREYSDMQPFIEISSRECCPCVSVYGCLTLTYCFIIIPSQSWSRDNNAWKKIESPNTPAPRCSHQAAVS